MQNNNIISEAPSVLVSILNWQHFESTINCVKSVLDSAYSNFEIVIIDNASPNDSFEKLKNTFPELNVIKSEENNGYAAGHSISLDIAIQKNVDLIWILNNDLLVNSYSLSALVDAYRKHVKGIFGSVSLKSENPDIVDFAGGEDPQNVAEIFSYNLYHGCLWDELPADAVRKVQSVEGSSMLIPLEIIKKFGFMQTDFFMYGEETDYCLRLQKSGVCSYIVRDSKVLHKGAGSFHEMDSLSVIPAYYRRRNFLRIMKEHYRWSVWKCLNHPESITIKFKFLMKCWIKRDLKRKNLIDYYRLKGTIDGAFNKKEKKLNPVEFLQ